MVPTHQHHIFRLYLAWQVQKAEHENIANMNEALLAMFLAAIQPAFNKSTKRDLIGRVSTNFWDVFDMFLTKYAKVKPMDLKANRARMESEWYPSVPIETCHTKGKWYINT